MTGSPFDPDQRGANERDDASDSTAEPPESVLDTNRYAHLSLGDGAVVIYDRESPDRWVQSDVVFDIDVSQ